jgi:hypothetical protein
MFPRGQERILYCILGIGRVIQTTHGDAAKIGETLGYDGRHREDIGAERIIELLNPSRLCICHVHETLLEVAVQAVWKFAPPLSPKSRGMASQGVG